MEAQPWWEERIEGALVSYWIYQHLGNLSPAEIARRGLLEEVLAAGDAGPLLRKEARGADKRADGSMWSYVRDLGRVRLVVFDSREGRVFEPVRKMNDDEEWEWVRAHATGGFDHLLLADTLPVLMPPAFHYAEAWSERVAAGAWGKRFSRLGEKLRRAVDLEHWAAFQFSFKRVVDHVVEVASGKHGEPPATVVMLGGDIHHAYLAEVAIPQSRGAHSKVWQAVCSPFRNPLDKRERRQARLGNNRPVDFAARWIAKAAGVEDPPIRWRLCQKPTFDNQFATLDIKGREMAMRIERTVPGDHVNPKLKTTLERRLA
jgi:hypothetical protein